MDIRHGNMRSAGRRVLSGSETMVLGSFVTFARRQSPSLNCVSDFLSQCSLPHLLRCKLFFLFLLLTCLRLMRGQEELMPYVCLDIPVVVSDSKLVFQPRLRKTLKSQDP